MYKDKLRLIYTTMKIGNDAEYYYRSLYDEHKYPNIVYSRHKFFIQKKIRWARETTIIIISHFNLC